MNFNRFIAIININKWLKPENNPITGQNIDRSFDI